MSQKKVDIIKMPYINKSKSNNWGTPAEIKKKYVDWFDPCPFPRAEWDALKISWSDKSKKIFVNPPYNKLEHWTQKCVEEQKKGCLIHLLIPARTDTKYFHKDIFPNATVKFIKGRLKYTDLDNPKNKLGSAPFPSCICVFEPKNDNIEKN